MPLESLVAHASVCPDILCREFEDEANETVRLSLGLGLFEIFTKKSEKNSILRKRPDTHAARVTCGSRQCLARHSLCGISL